MLTSVSSSSAAPSSWSRRLSRTAAVRTAVRFLRYALVALAAAGLFTACDLQDVQQAADDFRVVVELPPIETVANVQVMDLRTHAPVNRAVTLTFDGPDAGAVIDAYSDPISKAALKGGFTTFGIDNARVPSSGDPVRLRVKAEAEGYLTTTVPVVIDEPGTANVRVRLVPDDPRQSPEGVAGSRTHANVDRGALRKDVAASTSVSKASGASAHAAASIPKGTALYAADGSPLSGRLTVDLAAYEANDKGLRALPASVRENKDGRSLVSAARLRVQDAQGRTAARFGTNGTAMTTKAGASAKSVAGLSLTLSTGTVSSNMALSHYVLRLEDGTDVVEVYVPMAAVDGAGLTVGVQGSQLIVSGVAHDISTLTGSSGDLYLSLSGVASRTCTPSGTINVAANGHTGTGALTVGGNGLYYEKSISVTGGQTTSVSVSNLVTDPTLPDVSTEWPVTAIAPNGETTTALVDLCGGGTATMTLPAPSSSLIDATVSVDPNCPAGQQIPFTGEVDGYVLNYRKAGTTADFQPVSGNAVTVTSTDTYLTGVDVQMTNVEASTDYEFYAAFDGESGYRTITMPATDGGTVVFTDSEFTQHCQ